MYRRLQQIIKPIFLSKSVKYVSPGNIPSKWINESIKTSTRKLAARYWRHPDNPENKTVLLVHPYNTQAKDFYLESGHPELYYHLGFHIIIFDFNGFGESLNTDLHFQKDILEVAHYYRNKWNLNHLVIHGISFGAAMSTITLTQSHPFSHAIIEGSLDKMPNYFKARNKNLYYIIKFFHTMIPSLEKANRYDMQIRQIKSIQKIMFIYTQDDDLTTIAMGKKLQANCPIESEMVTLKGNHMEAIHADPILYRKTISNYINAKH